MRMTDLYGILKISKQAFHQGLDRELKKKSEQMQLVPIVMQIRRDHPRLSCRQMYYMLKPSYMGRDQFERFCYARGFKVTPLKRYYRTTDSLGVTRFPNLLQEAAVITGVNQIWVSDITYFQMGEEVSYITLIQDLYSRKIVGWSLSNTLRTEATTIKALEMAIRDRDLPRQSNLIFHSDGGGQYYSKAFRKLTESYGIRNSMCESVYENPHAERINGTIKNDYLIPYSPKNYLQLQVMLDKTVYLYNHQKPHQSLHRCNPDSFEEMTEQGKITKSWRINKKQRMNNKTAFTITVTEH
jgi:putative transposase